MSPPVVQSSIRVSKGVTHNETSLHLSRRCTKLYEYDSPTTNYYFCCITTVIAQILLCNSEFPQRKHQSISPQVYKSKRLRQQGAFFTLSAIRREDEGLYVCRVEAETPVELRHRLQVLYPPTVSQGIFLFLFICVVQTRFIYQFSW